MGPGLKFADSVQGIGAPCADIQTECLGLIKQKPQPDREPAGEKLSPLKVRQSPQQEERKEKVTES
jgi:hypothetical protein